VIERSAEHGAHLSSPQWRTFRDLILRLGHEEPEDVQVLCPPCHEQADVEPAVHAERRRWARRVDGWASKRWGEEWLKTRGEE